MIRLGEVITKRILLGIDFITALAVIFLHSTSEIDPFSKVIFVWGLNILAFMFLSIICIDQFSNYFDLKAYGRMLLVQIITTLVASLFLGNLEVLSWIGPVAFLGLFRVLGMRVIFYAFKHGAM